MITTVTWQYILLNGDPATGYRVKRRTNGPPPVVGGGTDTPMANNWVSAAAPSQIHYIPDNRDYVFVFWSLTGIDAQSMQSAFQIQTSPIANDSHVGGQWSLTAKAYYVWNFGQGGGDNALLIDAFDLQAGDFIPDDFVDCTPDPGGLFTVKSNDWYNDTTADLAPGTPPPSLTISARNIIPARQFAYWLYWPAITPLFYSNDRQFPATVGVPNPHDVVVHYNDVVVAIAIYSQDARPPRHFTTEPGIFDTWWWIKTRGGLVAPGPPPPWLQEYEVGRAIAELADAVAPHLRGRLLEVALEQIDNSAAALRRLLGSGNHE
jgi:hypothetical protein